MKRLYLKVLHRSTIKHIQKNKTIHTCRQNPTKITKKNILPYILFKKKRQYSSICANRSYNTVDVLDSL